MLLCILTQTNLISEVHMIKPLIINLHISLDGGGGKRASYITRITLCNFITRVMTRYIELLNKAFKKIRSPGARHYTRARAARIIAKIVAFTLIYIDTAHITAYAKQLLYKQRF